MLTARGYRLLVALLALLAVGVGFQNAGLALAGLTLTGWFLGSWLWFNVRLCLVRHKLAVEREVSTPRGPISSLWSGQTYTVHVQLWLNGSAGLPYVYAVERVPPILEHRDGPTEKEGSVGHAAPLEWEYRVTCPSPGCARFAGVSVHIADVQGFFHDRLFVDDARVYRVLPALADARGHVPAVKRHNLLPLLGQHTHPRPGTGSELLDLRDYLPGDPPKTIAWKASARRGRLMTKEFDSEVPIRCTLFVDTSNSVRVGGVGRNALARLVEIASAVAQASAGARDLTGLCIFDEQAARYVRPARGERHLVQLFNLLADAASLAPLSAQAPLERLVPLAYGLAQEVCPECLDTDVNALPLWQRLITPRLASSGSVYLPWPLSVVYRVLSPYRRRRYRWRKQLAALLSVRYGLAPGGLSALLEDDELCSHYLQCFLNEHQVHVPLPFYDSRGRYLFAAPGKIDVLARWFLRAVARGRDNELFVILADLLELGDRLGPLLAAVKVALARHHQVMIVCPWPEGMALPGKEARRRQGELASEDSAAVVELPSELWNLPESPTVQSLVQRITIARLRQAYHWLRRSFARLGVPVLCAREGEPARLVLERLQRLRVLERGKP